MEFKIIFWVIVGIIYLITKARKKAQTPEEPRQYEQPQVPSSTGKPVTFEDLLREIQSAKSTTPPVESKPVAKPYDEVPNYPKYEDYDDEIEDEVKQPVEQTNYDYRKQDNIYDVYEKAKQAAFQQPSLEETMKVEDTVVRFGHFKEYQKHEEPSLASLVAKDFEDAEKVKRAFVMSEILRRKY
jgi:hypothetical protein